MLVSISTSEMFAKYRLRLRKGYVWAVPRVRLRTLAILSPVSICKLLHKQECKIVPRARPDAEIVGMNERREMRGADKQASYAFASDSNLAFA